MNLYLVQLVEELKLILIKIAEEVEKRLENCNKNIKVAVMGCVVNGPGEAREADIGIAGGKGEGLIFKKGEIIKKVKEEDLVEELNERNRKLVKNVSTSGEHTYNGYSPEVFL